MLGVRCRVLVKTQDLTPDTQHPFIMGDWIGLGVIVLVLAGSLWGLSHLGRTREPMSEEEFERRAAEARGTMSALELAILDELNLARADPAGYARFIEQQLGHYDGTLYLRPGLPAI